MAQKLSDRQARAQLSSVHGKGTAWLACGPATLLLAALWLSGCGTTPPPAPPAAVAQPGQESAAQGALANDILFRAIGLVGTPYQWGGNTPEGGFDCSGLIGFVYRDVAGLQLPRTTRELLAMPAQPVSAGDLVFFATGGSRKVNHAGIYVGEGRFVHAPSKGGTVRLDFLADRYWDRAFLDARRVL